MRRERIEAFVTGRLTESERSAFEAEMRADETLRAEVEIERVLQSTLQRTPELRFRELVQQVSEAQEKVSTRDGGVGGTVIPIEPGRWKWWAAAASVAVLLAVGALLALQGPSSHDLALAQVRSYSFQVRGDSSAVDPRMIQLMEARQAILDDRAADALPDLQQPMDDICPDADRNWLLGVAHLLTGDEDKARRALEAASKAGCAVSPKAGELLKAL